MNFPLFSIIIPTLNEELFIPKLLKDLTKQKENNFEIIIVDSLSQDKTKDVVQSFTKLLPLYFIENDRKNISVQRNFGAKKAKGKYFVFLDADSRVEPSFTKKLRKAIEKKKGLFFVPRLKTDDPNTEAQYIMDIVNFLFEVSQNLNRPFTLGGGMFLEKNYFFTILGFDEKLEFGEDYDIARRSFKWGVRAKFLSDVAVVYSLRRIRREGKLQAYYKYFMSTAYYLIRGKTQRKLFDYELGGHLYQNYKGKSRSNKDLLETLLNKAKKAFKNLLEE